MQVFTDSPDSLLASLLSNHETGKLILVTGQSGAGKTRWCAGLAEQAKSRGIHAVGLLSPAVFEGQVKTGIDLIDVKSGARKSLAVRRDKSGIGQFTLDWGFDDEVLNWGNLILGQLHTCQLLIIDELGPLEFNRGGGLTNGIGLIAARRYELACVVVRPALLEIAHNLWPWGLISHVRATDPTQVSA